MSAYADFLARKAQFEGDRGFEPTFLPDELFDFQEALVVWAAFSAQASCINVIDRTLVLWSNPGETVLTPFMGVGSEVYGAVRAGRRGIGVELKPSYYRQALKNLAAAAEEGDISDQLSIGMAAS